MSAPGEIITYDVTGESQAAYQQVLENLAPRSYKYRRDDVPREEPWFNFTLPWEQPKLFHGRRKWRKRQERIFWLERGLGYIDTGWELCDVFPWRACYDPDEDMGFY